MNTRKLGMSRRRSAVWLFAIAALALPGCANIQRAVEGAKGEFERLDTNDDDVISKQESQKDQPLMKSFTRLDTNNDGNINPAEYNAAHTMIADVDFKRLDFNSDGVVSEREAKSSRPSLRAKFSIVDSDGDRNVSRSEYRAATTNLIALGNFGDIDSDNDGVIDTKEARRSGSLLKTFNVFDIDNDNLISRAEFKLAQQR